MVTFDVEVLKVFEREGYWTDDSDDPGKLTIWGIASHVYPEDVERMKLMGKEDSKEYAKHIYKRDYWDMCGADEMLQIGAWATAAQMFDFAITSGVRIAVETLQLALNSLGGRGFKWQELFIDGLIGPRTLAAVRACLSYNNGKGRPKLIARAYQIERCAFYNALARKDPFCKRAKFIDGWINRAYGFDMGG